MLQKIKTTIHDILVARQYRVDGFYDSDDTYLTHKLGDPSNKLYVFFSKDVGKVGVISIRQYIKEMKQNGVNNSILIVKDEITAFAKQMFVEEKTLNIEYFKDNELIVDKTKHVLVPKHELISEDEKKELLKLYSIKDMQLPKILSSDPISRYYGAKKGNVFKITRSSETCGQTIYYRIVV